MTKALSPGVSVIWLEMKLCSDDDDGVQETEWISFLFLSVDVMSLLMSMLDIRMLQTTSVLHE